MQKAKHSKFRNTGLLFELLARQITADLLGGKDESSAQTLLIKYFSEGKELGKEWQLYNFLINETTKDDVEAERYLNIALKTRAKLDNNRLKREKFDLIKEIKESYPLDDLLKSNIKNYKVLASIYKLFEDHTNAESKFDIREILQSRNCICENLSGKRVGKVEESDDVIKYYRQQSEEIRLLSYKILMESMNTKYKDLDDNQKRILREYINNVANTNSLHTFVINEIVNIKQQLVELKEKITEEVIRIKLNETIHQLEESKPTSSVKDNQIMVLLLSYELIKEIKSQLT